MLDGAERLPTIEGERVRLRWLAEADVPALYAIFGDAEVCRYWSSAAYRSIEEAARLRAQIVECFRERSLFQWGIALRDTDEVIGTCTLASLSPAHRRAELGFALRRASWRRGYVREILPRLVDFAFGSLGLHRLEADVDPENAASLDAIRRLGFRQEGHFRDRYFVHGLWHDAAMFGLLRSEWEGRRTGAVSPESGPTLPSAP